MIADMIVLPLAKWENDWAVHGTSGPEQPPGIILHATLPGKKPSDACQRANRAAMPPLDDYLAAHHDAFERDLFELLRIESISAKSEHRADVARAAQWVADQFGQLGLTVELAQTAGNPIVYAESPAVPGAPTVLVYGHYDVQPVEPLAEWLSPPFEPTRPRRQCLRPRGDRRQGADADARQKCRGLAARASAGCRCN